MKANDTPQRNRLQEIGLHAGCICRNLCKRHFSRIIFFNVPGILRAIIF